MTARTQRRWAWIHKWTSLVSTLFMLLLCLTGLPLIFHHEIGHLTGTEVEAPEMREGTPQAPLDQVLAAARAAQPGLLPQYLFRDPGETATWLVGLNTELTAMEGGKTVVVDARTAQVLGQPRFDEGVMYVLFKLHVDLFAGLPGKLFLGFMGLLLVVAIVSGVVLYAPFARRQPFATVRQGRGPRLRWLDLHNVLGIVTLAWALVVGFTGVLNTWADLVLKYWQYDQVAAMVAPYQGQAPRPAGPVGAAVQAAQSQEPHMSPGFVAFPGTAFASPHHYAVFMRGSEPLTARLFKPVLVDAQSALVSDSRDPPWYLTALLISQPLHFGDYAGMPMKILWAVLDLVTIVVLGSGLYLWWQRRGRPVDELVALPADGSAA